MTQCNKRWSVKAFSVKTTISFVCAHTRNRTAPKPFELFVILCVQRRRERETENECKSRVVVAFEVDFILFDLASCSHWIQPSSASHNI